MFGTTDEIEVEGKKSRENSNGVSQAQKTEQAVEDSIRCPICNKLSDSKAINNNLDPHLKIYFMKPQQILADCFQKMTQVFTKVSKFQEFNKANLERYYAQKVCPVILFMMS